MAASTNSDSDRIFDRVVSDDFITKHATRSRALNQRLDLIRRLRKAVEDAGQTLASKSNDLAFSRHGSLSQRLTLGSAASADIDIYVALNGKDVPLSMEGWLPVGTSPNKNEPELKNPEYAREWMLKMVKQALPENTKASPKLSKRGVELKSYGERDYDIIPTFLFRKGEEYAHLIPKEREWEQNPTSRDMYEVLRLGEKFPRDSDKKILGYRDIIKAFKYASRAYNWKKVYRITSFVIRVVVTNVYHTLHSLPSSNHGTIKLVLETLNASISKGSIVDPYTQKPITLTSTTPITLENFFDGLFD